MNYVSPFPKNNVSLNLFIYLFIYFIYFYKASECTSNLIYFWGGLFFIYEWGCEDGGRGKPGTGIRVGRKFYFR